MAQPKVVGVLCYKFACQEGTAVSLWDRDALERLDFCACIKHGKSSEMQSVGNGLHSTVGAASNSMGSVVLTL